MDIPKPQSKIVINKRLTHDGLISDVVKEMKRLNVKDRTHPLVIQTAKKLKRKTDLQTIKAVFDYVVALVPYKKDPADREHIVAPIQLLSGNVVGEDCESMALLLSTLLNALGFRTKYTVMAWRDKKFTHVILQVKLNGEWVELDATQGKAGFGKSIPPEKLKRSKDYGVPPMDMKVQTLEDRYLNDCPCNSQGLAGGGGKCGCGGKCGGKNKNQPTNQNIINIGNEVSKVLGITGGGKNTEKVIEKEIPKPYPVVKEKIVKELIPDALTRERVESIVNDKNVPVRVLQTAKTDYIYRDWY